MIPKLLLVTVLCLSQASRSTPVSLRFDKPSEAFAYANAPMSEWEADVKTGRPPKTRIAPQAEVQRRAKALCPTFAVEDLSGEELYWLAKLCASQPAIGLTAVQRYLEGSGETHRPEAHLLLSEMQLRTTRSWASSWETLRTILQEDPIESEQEVRLRVAIDEEADENEATALKWAEERYSILLQRFHHPKTDVPPLSAGWVILAGADLTHRYYLAREMDRAADTLAEINRLKAEAPDPIEGWPSDHLNRINMEMKPALPIPVLRPLGSNPGTDVVRLGRVELVSFFFLHCAPCLSELEDLNSFQKRYPKDKVLVVDVTTYKAALQPDTPPHKKVESAIERTRRKRSPHLAMAITSEQTLRDYGIRAFPVVAVIDKAGRLRYAGLSNGYDAGEDLDRLVRRLLDE
jgi:thiol-disulfide isomerase/thioredoxin